MFRKNPSPEGREWPKGPGEGGSSEILHPSPAAPRHPLPSGEGFIRNIIPFWAAIICQPMTFISATRLRIRSIRFLPAFFYYALISTRQARRAPGNLGMDARNDANLTFWTATAWKDEAAMRAFMMGEPHRKAMPKLVNWCCEASVVHWMQESPALPDWQEAHRRMAAEGRPSKVNHPSPDHLAFRIPLPRK